MRLVLEMPKLEQRQLCVHQGFWMGVPKGVGGFGLVRETRWTSTLPHLELLRRLGGHVFAQTILGLICSLAAQKKGLVNIQGQLMGKQAVLARRRRRRSSRKRSC
jgi:hypothetical protein